MLSYFELLVSVSDKVVANSCIFPVSAVAFYLLNAEDFACEESDHSNSMQDWYVYELQFSSHTNITRYRLFVSDMFSILFSAIYSSLDKFVSLHQRCYLILIAAIHSDREKHILSYLQQRYINAIYVSRLFRTLLLHMDVLYV